jgi:hypothetical protein
LRRTEGPASAEKTKLDFIHNASLDDTPILFATARAQIYKAAKFAAIR